MSLGRVAVEVEPKLPFIIKKPKVAETKLRGLVVVVVVVEIPGLRGCRFWGLAVGVAAELCQFIRRYCRIGELRYICITLSKDFKGKREEKQGRKEEGGSFFKGKKCFGGLDSGLEAYSLF